MIRSRCEVLSARKNAAYLSITIVAPEIAERARPGQFIQVAVPAGRDKFLRRPFFVHQTSRRGGWAGTLEFVADPASPGMDWVGEIRAHQFLDVVGPLGRPFGYPANPMNCLLVTKDHGAAQLYFLAEELQARGFRVDMVVGASTQDRVFKPIDAKRLSRTIAVVTEDGTLGEQGTIMDVLPSVVERTGTQVLYCTGPRPLLRAVAEFSRAKRIPTQVAVEDQMPCGIGNCWTCVVPVLHKDGRDYDHLRACVDGPAFNAARILWDRWVDEPATGADSAADMEDVDELAEQAAPERGGLAGLSSA